jgi:hypothetical protein
MPTSSQMRCPPRTACRPEGPAQAPGGATSRSSSNLPDQVFNLSRSVRRPEQRATGEGVEGNDPFHPVSLGAIPRRPRSNRASWTCPARKRRAAETSRHANPTARSVRSNDAESANRADAGRLGALSRPGRPPRRPDGRRSRDATKVTPRRAPSEASLDRELNRLHDQIRVRASPDAAGGGTSLRTHVPRSGCWTWRPSLHERASSETRHGRRLFREWVRRVGSINAGRSRHALVGRRPGSSSVLPQPVGLPAGGRLRRSAGPGRTAGGERCASALRGPVAGATEARVIDPGTGAQAHGSIGRLLDGNVEEAQRTRRRSKALRSRARKRRS